MKRHLLCFLTISLISLNVLAQNAPRIVSISAAGDGAFISWFQDEDPGATAVAYRVLQTVDGEMITVNETADLNSGFFNHMGVMSGAAGPLTYSVATIDAAGEVVAVSDSHTTSFVSVVSEPCADPIVIEWTPYIGFDQLIEHTVFVGIGALSEMVGVFEGDVFTAEYALQEGDSGDLSFSIQSTPNNVTQVASNIAVVDSCVEPEEVNVGIDELLVASLVVGPNPVQNIVNVSYDQGFDEELTLSVYTLDGRAVDTTTFVGQSSLEANNWVQGIYVYNITDNTGALVSSGKLLK